MYSEGLIEETTFLLAEWLASPAVLGSIGFPEIVVPITVLLKKALKASSASKFGSSKEQGFVKTLLERVGDSAKWVEEKRRDVAFAPGMLGEVAKWETKTREKLDDAPLSKYLKVQRKTREKQRKLLEKARKGEDEILDQD